MSVLAKKQIDIAHWIRLRLPSCGPGLKCKQTMFSFLVKFCATFFKLCREKDENKQKEAGFSPYLKTNRTQPAEYDEIKW